MPEAKSVRLVAKEPAELVKPSIQAETIRALGQGSVARILKIFSKNPPEYGAEQTLKAYSKMPWLRAINDKIGGALASLRWRAFIRVGEGEKGHRPILRDVGLQNMRFHERDLAVRQMQQTGELVEIDSPIIEAIYNEGDQFTGVTLRELTQKYLDLVGEAFWIKVRNSEGMPTQFLPVPPHWIADTPSEEKPYFELEAPNRVAGNNGDNKIDPEDMIWFCHPNPYQPYHRGVGMGATLADELETDEYAAKFLKTFFYNQARPDFLIHAENLAREDVVRLEQRWTDKIRGMFRAFTPFFSNRKLEVTRLTADYGHLQMLDLRAAQRDVCLQVYGAQPEIFGITEASNRATSEVAEYLFSRWVIVPRADFLRSVLQQRLVPDYDDRIILHFDSPIMKDKEHLLKVATIAPWTLDIDEWRDMMELLPLPDGRGAGVHCKPLNYEFFDINDPMASQEEPPPDNTPDDDDDTPEDDSDVTPSDSEDEDDNSVDNMLDSPAISVAESIAGEFAGYVEEARGIAWVMVEDLADHLENRDFDTFVYACSKCFGDHEALDIEVQKQIVKHGISLAESVKRWCPKDAKLEPYTAEMHGYVKNGLRLMDEFEDRAMVGLEDAAARALEEMTPRKAAELIAAHLGLSDDQWDELLLADAVDRDDLAEAADEKLMTRFPLRLAADALSFAQLQIAKEAMKNGYLAKRHISRVWETASIDMENPECRAMKDTKVHGADFWTMGTGVTVSLPTRSRPDCHCRERLVINGGEA